MQVYTLVCMWTYTSLTDLTFLIGTQRVSAAFPPICDSSGHDVPLFVIAFISTGCLRYFSCCCDKMLRLEQPKEGRISSSLEFVI